MWSPSFHLLSHLLFFVILTAREAARVNFDIFHNGGEVKKVMRKSSNRNVVFNLKDLNIQRDSKHRCILGDVLSHQFLGQVISQSVSLFYNKILHLIFDRD